MLFYLNKHFGGKKNFLPRNGVSRMKTPSPQCHFSKANERRKGHCGLRST